MGGFHRSERNAPPEPSAQVHLIKAGDTLSKVGTSSDLTPGELLAANPQITDHDNIAIGDDTNIPARVPEECGEPSARPS